MRLTNIVDSPQPHHTILGDSARSDVGLHLLYRTGAVMPPPAREMVHLKSSNPEELNVERAHGQTPLLTRRTRGQKPLQLKVAVQGRARHLKRRFRHHHEENRKTTVHERSSDGGNYETVGVGPVQSLTRAVTRKASKRSSLRTSSKKGEPRTRISSLGFPKREGKDPSLSFVVKSMMCLSD